MPRNRYRWVVVTVFFCFMFLHQSDKLLIGPLTTPIMETFNIDEVQMGAVIFDNKNQLNQEFALFKERLHQMYKDTQKDSADMIREMLRRK